MLPEGQQLSHYRLARLLKSGGMGEVYLADDMVLHRQVAIKIIHSDTSLYAGSDDAKEATRLFIREAQAIAQLDQINILPVYDSGEELVNGMALMYLVMPYRREGSLKDWLRTHLGQELLPLQAVERIVHQAAFALQHAHDRQIIHQDVKPANFLVYSETEDPGRLNLQLADFGVAKFMMKANESQVVRGTPTYMAPEQWEGHPVPATDQYALAVMAYELLTGRPPFVGNGYYNIWHQHFHVEAAPPGTMNPNLPKGLDAVLLRALAKSPEHRFSSVSAFGQAFQRALYNSGDIHQMVTISTMEARTGTNRALALPTGRWVTVTIPPGAYHGQVLRLEGYGAPISDNGLLGALVVTIAVAPEEAVVSPANIDIQQQIPTLLVNRYDAGPTPAVNRYDAGPTPAVNRYDAGLTPAVNRYDAGSTPPVIYPRKRQTRWGTVLIIAFALLLLIGGISFFYLRGSGTGVTATATATATSVTATHVVGTATTPIIGYPSYLRGQRGTFALDDPLNDRNEVLGWDLAYGTCNFTGGALDAKEIGDPTNPGYFRDCIETKQTFVNFAYEIKMTFVTGGAGDCGGVIFRGDLLHETRLYYYYLCQDGRYGLVRYSVNAQDPTLNPTIRKGTTSLVKAGAGQTNLLAVVAQGYNFDLYVNQQYIDSVYDTSYSAGVIGVLVKSFGSATTEVAFSDARVWTL